MAETQQPMSSKGAGNATGSFSKAQPVHGASDVQGASLKINQDDFFSQLDALVGSRNDGGCAIGAMVSKLEEPIQKKLNEIFINKNVESAKLAQLMSAYGLTVSSSDVLRRHRRRLQGRDGCKCPQILTTP
jgi:hypothetical protein